MTSKRGGTQSGKTITGAKCLMIFELEDPCEKDNLKSGFYLRKLIDKTLCSERTEVTVLEDEDFGHQVLDSQTKDFYGTKVGYPILEFTPTGTAESKGRDKHRCGLIMAQAFKLKKHRQWEDGKRETTYSFQETKDLVFVAHLKGCSWGKYLHLVRTR